jgi:hypothetical protein
MTMEPEANTWIATQRDKQGDPLVECALDVSQMRCWAVAAD